MQVVIAPMTIADLAQAPYIEQDSFISTSWTRESFYTEITRNKYAHYTVARLMDRPKVIGYGGIWIVFDEAHITTLAVHPSYRRVGIGTFLLKNMLQTAFARGAGKIFLEVRVSNTVAKRLYEKYGFRVIARRKNYYFDEDALIMICESSIVRTVEEGSVLDDP